MEQQGVERSRKAMETADLILMVMDQSALLQPGNAELGTENFFLLHEVAETGKPWILIHSKCDLTNIWAGSAGFIGKANNPAAVIHLSSVTGQGFDRLEQAVADLFPAGDPKEAGGLLTDQRQEEAVFRARNGVRRAREALSDGLTPDAVLTDAEEALEALGELTGRTAKEEMVSRIFSRFCVGK